MDREKKDELPQMQVGFIDLICLPLYKVRIIYNHIKQNYHAYCIYECMHSGFVHLFLTTNPFPPFSNFSGIFVDFLLYFLQVLADTFPWMQPLYDGTLENRKHWQDLAEKVEMGLTWIDHDVIEKPVEEFSGKLFEINTIFVSV